MQQGCSGVLINLLIENFTMRLIALSLFTILLISCSYHKNEDEHEDEHGHAHNGGVILEPEKAVEFGVEYENIVPGTFHDVIKTSGSIESSSADIYSITAKRSGIVTLANGISVGTPVSSGEKIATVSSEGVQGGDVNQASMANLEAAKAEYERLKPLYEERLVSASVYKEAERAYKEAKALAGSIKRRGSEVVTSPLKGSVQNLLVKSGDYVDVGSPIATVTKNSTLLLKADLPARESRHLGELETANFITEGGGEVVKLTNMNGKRISGPSASVVNGYIPVYFSFDGNPLSFPGGYAEVYLICGERKDVISVPKEALVEIQGNKYVYISEDEDEYEKRLVKTGSSDGERIEITDGLKEGERIVSKGASIIRMAEVSSIAPPSHSHNH